MTPCLMGFLLGYLRQLKATWAIQLPTRKIPSMNNILKEERYNSQNIIYFPIELSLEGISSIAKSIGLARRLTDFEFVKSFYKLDVNRVEVLNKVRFTSDHYSRTVIDSGSNHEVVVVGWLPGQGTPIHGHRGRCLFRVISGELCSTLWGASQENDAEQLALSYHLRHSDGAQYISDKIGRHKVINESDDICISLHVYTWGSNDPHPAMNSTTN